MKNIFLRLCCIFVVDENISEIEVVFSEKLAVFSQKWIVFSRIIFYFRGSGLTGCQVGVTFFPIIFYFRRLRLYFSI